MGIGREKRFSTLDEMRMEEMVTIINYLAKEKQEKDLLSPNAMKKLNEYLDKKEKK
jgi:hypothetical protein